MWIPTLKYLVFLLLGIAIGVYVFGEYTQRETSSVEDMIPVQTREARTPRIIETPVDGSDEELLETIRGKNAEIANLKAEIEQMRALVATADVNNSQNESMQTMSVEEMAVTVGESLKRQFKNRVLTMPDEEMEEIKQSFYDELYSEWGMAYQNSIMDFFAAADTGGQYYLQSVECKTKSCRLEIHTENMTGWREFYFSMTHQDWYDSFTLQEESDYPGTVIYYLIRGYGDGS